MLKVNKKACYNKANIEAPEECAPSQLQRHQSDVAGSNPESF